jgi:serine/threonine protein phosphatase PrpC
MASPSVSLPQIGKFYFDEEMVEADCVAVAGGEVAVYSRRCPTRDSPCEDSAAVIPLGLDRGVLVVADGMGGQPGGDRASSEAICRLAESLAEALDRGREPREAILDGIESANRAVSDHAVGAATTLAVVEIQGRLVRPYHVGDSMIMAVGQRGRLKLQTVAHSPVGYAVEAGFLDQDEAMHHEERHLVSNMIGTRDMHITIGPQIALADRDTLILASDGLSDNLHVGEIVERMRKGPLRRVASLLAEDARGRMCHPVVGLPSKPDDLTFIVFRPQPGT